MYGPEEEGEGGTKMSLPQKEIMVEFMEDHPDFAKGKLLGNDGKKVRKSMWEILTTQLNSVNGPNKTSQKWQRVWIDLKNKVKKKASLIRTSMTQTGGGPQSKVALTDMEVRIVEIIGDAAVYGLQSTQDAPLDSEDVNQPDVQPTQLQVLRDPQQPSTSRHLTLEEMRYSSEIRSPNESDTDALEDHNYFSISKQATKKRKVSQKSPPPSRDTEDSEPRRPLSASSSDEVTPRRRRVRPPTSAAQAAGRFAEIGETLNKRMESIDSKLDILIREKQESNAILKSLVAAIENLKK